MAVDEWNVTPSWKEKQLMELRRRRVHKRTRTQMNEQFVFFLRILKVLLVVVAAATVRSFIHSLSKNDVAHLPASMAKDVVLNLIMG